MKLYRRMVLAGATAAGLIGPAGVARAQPAPPPRQRLEDFVANPTKVAALQKAVRTMRARKPSDPTSWTFQAAMHAVAGDTVARLKAADPGVAQVVQFWNQCPHSGQSSADFVVWHRAYIYYFERILRAASGDPNLSLPYWNYTDAAQRGFPPLFADEQPDANGEPTNPLYDARREQAFMAGMYLLSPDVAAGSRAMTEKAMFGPTEREGFAGGVYDNNPRTRGLIEQAPHDLLHFAIGGAIGFGDPEAPAEQGANAGLMASVQTAAFDPIFWVHHANIDRLWTVWECQADRVWGSPPAIAWFDAKPWVFHDADKSEVRESRRFYIDRRNLALSYDTDKPTCKPLGAKKLPGQNVLTGPAPAALVSTPVASQPVGRRLSNDRAAEVSLQAPAAPAAPAGALVSRRRAARRVIVELRGLSLDGVTSVGYDVHVNAAPGARPSREAPSFAGTVPLFGLTHAHGPAGDHAAMASAQDAGVLRIDVTDIPGVAEGRVEVSIVPFDLLTPVGAAPRLRRPGALRVEEIAVIVDAPAG